MVQEDVQVLESKCHWVKVQQLRVQHLYLLRVEAKPATSGTPNAYIIYYISGTLHSCKLFHCVLVFSLDIVPIVGPGRICRCHLARIPARAQPFLGWISQVSRRCLLLTWCSAFAVCNDVTFTVPTTWIFSHTCQPCTQNHLQQFVRVATGVVFRLLNHVTGVHH